MGKKMIDTSKEKKMIDNYFLINKDIMGRKKTKKEPMLTGKERKKYTVWVGGTEVTDHFVTYSTAKDILADYTEQGYKDVVIQEGR